MSKKKSTQIIRFVSTLDITSHLHNSEPTFDDIEATKMRLNYRKLIHSSLKSVKRSTQRSQSEQTKPDTTKPYSGNIRCKSECRCRQKYPGLTIPLPFQITKLKPLKRSIRYIGSSKRIDERLENYFFVNVGDQKINADSDKPSARNLMAQMRKDLLKEGKIHAKPRIFSYKSAVYTPYIMTPLNEKKLNIESDKLANFNLKQNTVPVKTTPRNNTDFSSRHFKSKFCKQSKISEYVRVKYNLLSNNTIHRFNTTQVTTPVDYSQRPLMKSNAINKLNRIYLGTKRSISINKAKKPYL